MSLLKRIREHRPTVMFIVLVMCSIASMATGTRTSFLRDAAHMVVSTTGYPFLKTLQAVEGAWGYVTGLVVAYDTAQEEVGFYRKRVGDLMQHAAHRHELIAENGRLRGLLSFERNHPQFVLEPAEVIEWFKGFVRIDRGTRHGIEEAMCVVTPEGVVGVVTKADLLTSNVATLHSVECKVGALIKRNRVRGQIHGAGSDLSLNCTMNYIDMKDDIREGDEVVVCPESVFFPSGYPVGRVVSVHKTGTLWKTADVEPAVDLYSLDEVFVLRRAATPEAELAGAEPESIAVAPEMPDIRSLQEQYAP